VFASQVVERLERGGGWARHHNLVDTCEERVGKVDELLALGCHGEVSGRQVPTPLDQVGQQPITRGRNDDNMHREGFGFEILVDLGLKLFERVVGRTALLGTVQEIEYFAIDYEHADDTPFNHAIKVTRPGLEQALLKLLAEVVLCRGGYHKYPQK